MIRYFQIAGFLVLLFSCSNAFAAEEAYTDSKTGGQSLVGQQFIVVDDKWANPSLWATIESHRSVINLVTFELHEDSNLYFEPLMTCTIDLQISMTDSTGAITTIIRSLTVNFDTAFAQPFQRMEVYKAEGFHKIRITVLGITYTDINGSPPAAVPPLFRLAAEIHIDRTYKFDCDNAFNTITQQFLSGQNRLKIFWTGYPGAEEYDVEWTFYSDYSYIIDVYTGQITLDNLFAFNSTRITTSAKLYNIELVYPDGYLFYRVRPIHYDQAWNRIPGQWSSYGIVDDLAGIIDKKQVTGHEPKLNWQFTVQFAEEAKRKVSLSYFDGSLRIRQSLAYNSSLAQSLVNETVYDHIGRAAVTTLPVPTVNSKFQFFSKFNKYSSTAYEWSHFETGDCSFIPYPMDSSSGSAKYYSTTNSDTLRQQKFLPRAFGYPFTVSEFTPDQTNRIKRQSGVGKHHVLGSGHETKYYYGTPLPKQLDRLFGSEAGWSYHYLKNMVVDPNGQVSISYLDAHGRVIATSLAGDAPSSLQTLASNQDTVMVTDTILKNTMAFQWGLSAVHNQLVTSPGVHKIKYLVTSTPLELECGPTTFCFDAYYKLNLEVKDACNFTTPTIAAKADSNYTSSSVDTSCASSPSPISGTLVTPNLAIGSYNFVKNLTIPQSVVDYYSDWYMDHSVCLADSEAFVQDAIANIDFTGCNITCEECLEKLGDSLSFIENYIEILEAGGIIVDTDDYDKALAEWQQEKLSCEEICDAAIDPCAFLYQQMLLDVSPGGQYCRYEVDQYGVFTVSDPNSLLYTNGADVENFKYPSFPYEDEMGNAVQVINSYYSTVTPAELSVGEFVTAFNPSWAKSLVEYHPEYCYYRFCIDNAASNEYDKDMLNTATFDEAWTKGFFGPLGSAPGSFASAPSTLDPFFTGTAMGTNSIVGMKESINQYPIFAQINFPPLPPLSIWAAAVITVNKYDDPGFTYISPSDSLISVGECAGNKDQMWKIYRAMYLGVKFKYIDYERERYVIDSSCQTNICIGLKNKPCQAGSFWAPGKYDFLDVDTGDCELNSPYYEGDYMQRAFHFDACNILNYQSALNSGAVSNFQSTALPTQCKTICESYADGWMDALSACTMTSVEYDTIRARFIRICEAGCDGTHPWGSTSTPPGVSIDPGGAKDFDDVLKTVLGVDSNNTTSCNAFQITSPGSYEAQLHYNENVIITPDDCLCEKIEFLHDEYDIDDHGWTTFLGFLNFHYDTELTQEQLDDLEDVCEDPNCFFLENPIKISMELSCDTTGCIDCVTVMALDKKTGAMFPDTTFSNYHSYYATWMNQQTGFNLNFDDYKNFIDSCRIHQELGFTDTVFPIPTDQIKYVVKEVQYFGGSSILVSQSIQSGSLVRLLNVSVINVNSTSPEIVNMTTSLGGTSFQVLDTTEVDLIIDSVDVGSKLGASANGGSTLWELDDFKFKIKYSFTTNQMVLCDDPLFFTYTLDTASCFDGLMELAISQGNEAWKHYKDSVQAAFEALYIDHCMKTVKEQYALEYPLHEYHYTLYYYDLAGNLIKTVPPEGTKFITNSTDLTQIVNHRYDPITYDTVYTAHKLETRYWYNSLNQPRRQFTPDGDTTKFWYDIVGRLAVSQSARQRPDTFSYTLYDGLGRIIEVGKLAQTTDMTQTISQSPSSISSWIQGGTNRGEVTRTFYDGAVFTVPGLAQESLRSRVASTTYADTYSTTITSYDVATHYSYDIAGNVKTLIDDIQSLDSYKERYKRIDYEYDLVSGNVNRVNYQADSADQFIYKYHYDADNRITEAFTSRDGYIWDRDANYFYYDHGSLARTEIGEQQVQGMDYAYSIQGWLKGINELHLLKNHDMGQDGVSGGSMQHKRFPTDVFGMELNYFAGDYSQVTKGIKWEPAYAGSSFSTASKDLYNGNIRSIGLTMDKISPKTVGYSYGYDQLNRLVAMDVYNTFTGSSYSWQSGSNPTKDWRERVTYDANGNILTYDRHAKGGSWKMDSMIYNYYAGTNRLEYVDDKVSAGAHSIDIDDQASGNYTYDASGNLVSDTKEGITKIEWNAYGKVKKITKTGGTTITFSYDPAGNRILKNVSPSGQSPISTYYFRDAQGNILATYTLKDDTVRWGEQMIYGSSRLGLTNINKVTSPLNFTTQETDTIQYFEGLKNYELTNHLGNVHVVLSDKKIGIDDNSNGVNDSWITEQLSVQDYYPFGMVMQDRNYNAGTYRFGMMDKENDNEVSGIGNHIAFEDRGYDTRRGQWWSTDVLTAKYPSLAPYSFTNNNPIWFKEVDGRYFDYSNLTEDQKKAYESQILLIRENSPMFDYVYRQLEMSKSAFIVKYEQTSGSNPAEFRPNSDRHGGDIIYSPNVEINETYTLEENFHAYQLDNYEKFYPGVSLSNIEFESKVFNTMALNEAGFPMPVQGGTEDFTDFMQSTYDFTNPTAAQLESPLFQQQYKTGVQTMVDYYKKIAPDSDIFYSHKADPSNDGPNALIKVKKETESHVGPRLENGDFYSK